MTLTDLLKLVKRYWIVFLLVPLACVAIGAGSKMGTTEYVASSTLVANDPSGLVSSDVLVSTAAPIAQNEACEIGRENDVEIEVESPVAGSIADKARSLTFTVTGKNREVCEAAANEVAQRSADSASAVFSELDKDLDEKQAEKRDLALEVLGKEDPNARALINTIVSDVDYSHCTFTVGETAVKTTGGVSSKLIAISLLVGIFLAFGLIVLIDMMRRPIMSRDGVEAISDLPILTWPEASEEGARLWANICFACDDAPSSVAIVPVKSEVAVTAADELCDAIRQDGREVALRENGLAGLDRGSVSVGIFKPLSESVSTAYGAREAEVTVLCARLWKDDLTTLSATLKELAFSGAHVVGIALYYEK